RPGVREHLRPHPSRRGQGDRTLRPRIHRARPDRRPPSALPRRHRPRGSRRRALRLIRPKGPPRGGTRTRESPPPQGGASLDHPPRGLIRTVPEPLTTAPMVCTRSPSFASFSATPSAKLGRTITQ